MQEDHIDPQSLGGRSYLEEQDKKVAHFKGPDSDNGPSDLIKSRGRYADMESEPKASTLAKAETFFRSTAVGK